jgi:thiamine-phosphate pyrophosphorylase
MSGTVRTRTGAERRALLRAARVYLVIESRVDGESAEGVVDAALRGGVDVVQLRDKEADDEQLIAAARRLREVCDERGALLIVNDRPALAAAAGADGVHVGQDDAAVAAVRHTVGDDLLIGLSTHSPAQIAAAADTDADYIAVGPVYATATKPGLAPVGLELVRHASAYAARPFFAIGGIDPRRAAEVAAAGAERVAVVRAIRDAPDPRAAAADLRAELRREVAGGTPL